MAVALTKLNGFVEHLANGVHNLGSNQLVVALSNTAPGSESTPPSGAASTCILANVTQVAYTNCSSRNVTTTSCTQTAGTLKLVLGTLTLTASGAVGPFRYVYLYNSQGTGATNPLIGYYDYGSAVTLAASDTFAIDFATTNGAITVA